MVTSSFYAHLTTPVDDRHVVGRWTSSALPELDETAALPPVTTPSNEPLVPVACPRVRNLSAYHRVGWPGAPAISRGRVEAVRRLHAATETLPDRYGLAVFDGWRPMALQAQLYDTAYADPGLPPGFVSYPSTDPALPPPHPTGGTFDLTLTLDDVPLGLGTTFDEFSPTAVTAAFEDLPGPVRELRRLLYWTMRSTGFVVIDCGWWHFEYGTRRWAALTGEPPRYGATELESGGREAQALILVHHSAANHRPAVHSPARSTGRWHRRSSPARGAG
jgi:D-alanyl-D-alanine dipeptidase